MKRICEFCGKEYNWEEGQPNWTKDGIGNGTGTKNSKRFCCYECGKLFLIEKTKKTNLERYGRENIGQFNTPEFNNLMINKYGNKSPINIKQFKEKTKKTNLERYGVENPWQSKEIREKSKQTCLKKYKDPFSNREKYKQTCLEKYGKITYFGTSEFLEKRKITYKKHYGVDNYAKSNEFIIKQGKSKIKNNTCTKSNLEDQIYQLLLQKFPKTIHHYINEKQYPFECDFYIPELDLYIEYQGFITHGKEPYDENNKEHQNMIKKYKKLSSQITDSNKNWYNSILNVWTISDPLKRQIAKNNNLNWVEFFNMEEFMEWYNEY